MNGEWCVCLWSFRVLLLSAGPCLLKAPGEAEAELAHLNSTGIIDAILSDDVDNFLFGAKTVVRKCVGASTRTINPRHHSHYIFPIIAQASISLEIVSTLRKMQMVV